MKCQNKLAFARKVCEITGLEAVIENGEEFVEPFSYWAKIESAASTVSIGRSNRYGFVRTWYSKVSLEDLPAKWEQLLRKKWRKGHVLKQCPMSIPDDMICRYCNEFKPSSRQWVRKVSVVMCLGCWRKLNLTGR